MNAIEKEIKTEVKDFTKLVDEAKQEAKHCRKQDVEPFLGTDEEYAKAFETYKALVKANSLEDARYVPESFTKKQLRITSAGDLLDAAIPPRKLMLAPWFKVGDATMIYAPAGLGKSFLTLTIAMAAAGGGTIKGLNWKAQEPCRVLYVDGEMPVPDLRERLESIVKGGWIEGLDEELMRSNLLFFARLNQDDDEGFIDLAKEDHHKIVGGHAVKQGVKLVVFDNLSTLTETMEDENNAVQFRKINSFISKLKRREISVLVVHHANKEGFAYRGSSSIAVIYDSIIQLSKVTDENGPKAAADEDANPRVRLVFEKSRGKRSAETANRVVSMGDFGWAVVDGVEHDEGLARVVEIIKAGTHRKLSKRQARDVFGLNPLTIWKKVAIGLDRGLIGADEVLATFNCVGPEVHEAIARVSEAEPEPELEPEF